jgi:hypothetical protein
MPAAKNRTDTILNFYAARWGSPVGGFLSFVVDVKV